MRRDPDAEQLDEKEKLLREAGGMHDENDHLRADVMGSIAGASPSSPGYLGKIDSLITAHGAVDRLAAPTMGAASSPSALGRIRVANPDISAAGASGEPHSEAASRMGERPTLMKSGTEQSNYDFSLRDKPHILGQLPGEETGIRIPLMGKPQRGWRGKIGHVASRMANIAGDIFAPSAMAMIPGTDLYKRMEAQRAERMTERQRRLGIDETRAKAEQERAAAEDRRNEVLDRRNAILAGKEPKLTPDESAIAAKQKEINPATGKPYTAYEARVKLAQDVQDTKPDRTTRTSPFEAFAYGSPEEKKSAQDFLAFEKRMGAQYQRPTEAEFRYSLYQRDAEGYKAVFGDKAATADRAHATEMLKFFQKQRDAIQKDFMLGDDEKAQQLSEIDRLEGPFKEAAGVGGGGGDRVNVIDPNGQPGTIPRNQLGKAKKKGYRVAQ